MKYPTIVYKKGGPHRGPKGTTYKYIGCENKKEYDEAIRNGWLSDLEKACLEDKPDTGKAKKKVTEAISDSVETKSGKKFTLGKPGVVKRKEDYEEKPVVEDDEETKEYVNELD